jgi:CRP-like cAMP-binding protein
MSVTVTEFLQQHVPFLSGVTADEAHALALCSEQLSFGKGQTVLFQGTTVDGLYVVASGKVGVWVRADKSKPAQLAAELGMGEVFGEMSVLEFSTAGATIKAADEPTLLFLIPQDAFRGVLQQNPAINERAQALIASRKKKTAELLKPAPVSA